MKLKITELLDDYMEEDILLDYVSVPDNEKIKEATMKHLPKGKFRPLRVGMIAAAVAVLLTGTVAGIYAGRHWDVLIDKYFGATEQQKEQVADAVQDVYATVEQDGCTFTVTQVLGDENNILVALEIALPENLELDTVNRKELETWAGNQGYDLETMNWFLERVFGYAAEQESYTSGLMCDLLLYPQEGETLVSNKVDTGTEQGNVESGGVTSGSQSLSFGVLRREFDSESRHLRMLIYMDYSKALSGKECVLQISQLAVTDLFQYFSPEQENSYEQLLSHEVELRFYANYTPAGQNYTIYQEGEQIGTVRLSSFSAHFVFPQEPDDPNRLAPNWKDYIGDAPNFCVKMEDGTEINLQQRSSSIGDVQEGFFVSQEIMDLTKVDTLELNGYTFVAE